VQEAAVLSRNTPPAAPMKARHGAHRGPHCRETNSKFPPQAPIPPHNHADPKPLAIKPPVPRLPPSPLSGTSSSSSSRHSVTVLGSVTSRHCHPLHKQAQTTECAFTDAQYWNGKQHVVASDWARPGRGYENVPVNIFNSTQGLTSCDDPAQVWCTRLCALRGGTVLWTMSDIAAQAGLSSV
jgi:hypothetical protein